MSENSCQYQIKGRIWIEIDSNTFVGEGKADLLKKTALLGSLRKAALDTGMSYRQAWYSMNKLNKAGGTPLIVLKRGGKNGGIAQLTEYGERVVSLFEKSQLEFDTFLKMENQKITKH